jgi:alpha-tubulin suppressor-like RCC1 family protein
MYLLLAAFTLYSFAIATIIASVGFFLCTSTETNNRSPIQAYHSKILRVKVGGDVTCVVTEYERVICFGRATYGVLGQGNLKNLGDEPNEMGENMKVVDLNFTSIRSISVGARHACAVSDEGQVKCWGESSHGELGRTMNSSVIGDEPEEMGSS